MKDYFRLKSWKIVFLMYALAFAVSAGILWWGGYGKEKIVLAGTGENVTGFAWSSNVGWVSFNSKDCDTNGNGYIDTGACGGTDNSSTPSYNYGVNVELSSGNFSGHAWSPSVGWIDFAPTSGFPSAPLMAAHYDTATGNVTGWAKILSLGDDGWIKMRKDMADGGADYGVSLDINTGDFSGWAWNANNNGSGVGWISFNCLNDNSCASSNYKVVSGANTAPAATGLNAPNWSYNQAGELYALQALLRWTFSDSDASSTQSAYELEIDDNSDFSSPLKTGKLTGDATQYSTSTPLVYNKSYYWRVKVWDEYDVASNWAEYNSATDTPTEADDENNLTFTTYAHEMPDPDFTWFPLNPSKNEETMFTDASMVYLDADPSAAVSCDDEKCNWLWTVPNASITNPIASSTIIKFTSEGAQTVNLQITDVTNYAATSTKSITVNVPLPGGGPSGGWREVKPE
jgi:hypothetical protein